MYTGNVWGIALLIGGFLAALTGFELLLAAVCAGWAERSAAAMRRRPGASLLAGAGVTLVVGLVSALGFAVFAKLGPPGAVVNLLILAALSLPLVLGLATVSRFVGERMPSAGDAGRPWRATLRGGVTCALAFVTPVVGWLVILPVAIATGFGAVTFGLFASRAPAVDTGSSAPQPPVGVTA